MTTVLITGASGFIARHLAQTLAAAGMRVLGASRSAAAVPGFERVFPASLGDTLLPALASEPVDAVVHTALADGANAYRRNVDGTTRWMDEARAAGVGLQIFLSTLSAEEDALSDYGRAKWTLQQRFVDADEVVFRLGVVVGDGGMYARIRSSATRAAAGSDAGRRPSVALRSRHRDLVQRAAGHRRQKRNRATRLRLELRAAGAGDAAGDGRGHQLAGRAASAGCPAASQSGAGGVADG